MTDFATLQGPTALVCHREINSDAGGAVVFSVLLADGFLIECGAGGYAQRRAKELAEVINASDPSRFDFRKNP